MTAQPIFTPTVVFDQKVPLSNVITDHFCEEIETDITKLNAIIDIDYIRTQERLPDKRPEDSYKLLIYKKSPDDDIIFSEIVHKHKEIVTSNSIYKQLTDISKLGHRARDVWFVFDQRYKWVLNIKCEEQTNNSVKHLLKQAIEELLFSTNLVHHLNRTEFQTIISIVVGNHSSRLFYAEHVKNFLEQFFTDINIVFDLKFTNNPVFENKLLINPIGIHTDNKRKPNPFSLGYVYNPNSVLTTGENNNYIYHEQTKVIINHSAFKLFNLV
jgi:hypothetical protein